jgi:glycerol-3-phosphate dehydrogenase
MAPLGPSTPPYDLAIIGGGINGCGIARDAAGRGLSVFLCEMGDLGSGTSSRSTKLIHGGLRYLEHFDFRLVREALTEREVLWAIAPHIVHPMRFVLPHQEGLRPAWMLRVGLFLYDHLGGREQLPGTRILDLRTDQVGEPLKSGCFKTGFEYSDCWVDDARLVIINARDAADRGAVIRTRTRAVAASRAGDHWQMTVEDAGAGRKEIIAARALVNAAGPWVAMVAKAACGLEAAGSVRLVQGSHIVIRKLFEHDRAYIFQHFDGRVVFAIPYEGDFTLIGTTDRDYAGDPGRVSATEEEIAYLCDTVNGFFARTITRDDVVWTYSGVRPLYDDGASEAKAASREYVLDVQDYAGAAPLLSVIGGKITTYRRLAEAALERLAPYLPERSGLSAGWTGEKSLPGGDFAAQELALLAQRVARSYPFLDSRHVERLVRAYGTRTWALLGSAKKAGDLGHDFGATLTEAELRYLVAQEWARTAEDVAWRRSKLGLRLSSKEIDWLETWLSENTGVPASELMR